MGIFINKTDEEKKYDDIIRIIRSSYLHYEYNLFLENYVSSIRDKRRNNDFYELDFLEEVIVKLISGKYESVNEFKEVFNRLLGKVKFLLPLGENTEGYESIKREIINYHINITKENLFSEELYSLFDNRLDYIQIMDIIMKDEDLTKGFDKIVRFAVELGKEVDDQGLLKREIISYLNQYDSILSREEEYLESRKNEARMRFGVYPGVSEKNIASISREIQKAKGILEKLEGLEKKANIHAERVDAKTNLGIQTINDTVLAGKKEIEQYSSEAIKKMQSDLEKAKKELLDELNKFLASLESSLKVSSDKILNQMLLDAKERLEQIRTAANSLSNTTTVELLKIQNETQESLNTLKSYVESSPDLKSSLKIATDSKEVMNALLKFTSQQKEVNATSAGIILPDKEIAIPEKEIIVEKPVIVNNSDISFVPNFTMTEGLLHAFDKGISFDKRMERIEERIKLLESQGYIISEVIREALPWYLMGQKIVYFYGPTQSGKTTIADILVKIVETELLDGGKITEDHSVTSFNDVNGKFDENALFYALYYGKTIFYDELDNGNPDSLIVLGTYISKLMNKTSNPEKGVYAQFAKRRFVPVNANARIIAAGNTTGKGRNKQYSSRNKFDESTLERIVPIYVGYDSEVEKKIFNKLTEWYEFFNFFRGQCNAWAKESGLQEAEGNVTTSDATAITETINENIMSIGNLMRGIFVQIKEVEYLSQLIERTKSEYKIPEDISKKQILKQMETINRKPLAKMNAKDIATSFVYEATEAIDKGRVLIKRA